MELIQESAKQLNPKAKSAAFITYSALSKLSKFIAAII
jgi:hypothetical protein